jgi:hypothetical protein
MWGALQEVLAMRALIVFIILMAGIGLVQSERNQCYWHGANSALDWASCLVRF